MERVTPAKYKSKTASSSYTASEIVQAQKNFADEYAGVDFNLTYRLPRVDVRGNKSQDKPPPPITESIRYRRIMENSVVDAEREAENHEEKGDKTDFSLPIILDLIKRAEERKKREEQKNNPFASRYDPYDRYDPYKMPVERKELRPYNPLEAQVYRLAKPDLPFKKEYDPHAAAPHALSPVDIGHNATVARQLRKARPLDYRLAA